MTKYTHVNYAKHIVLSKKKKPTWLYAHVSEENRYDELIVLKN